MYAKPLETQDILKEMEYEYNEDQIEIHAQMRKPALSAQLHILQMMIIVSLLLHIKTDQLNEKTVLHQLPVQCVKLDTLSQLELVILIEGIILEMNLKHVMMETQQMEMDVAQAAKLKKIIIEKLYQLQIQIYDIVILILSPQDG